MMIAPSVATRHLGRGPMSSWEVYLDVHPILQVSHSHLYKPAR